MAVCLAFSLLGVELELALAVVVLGLAAVEVAVL